MAEVEVKNLYKRWGDLEAVKRINFDIKDGEFVFLLGPSGCGKSTTLRMIAGLEMPTSGIVKIGGRDVTFLEPKDRNIGMVFERYALYPHLSVYENLAYPLRIRKLSAAEMDKKIKEVAGLLEIDMLLERMPSQLSGGQMQRVAIGRMLVREAAVFLMDEPISHLDAKLRAHMRVELKRLQREVNSTTLFVSHDQLEAMTMGDRIVVMNMGEIQQFDTPQRTFDMPANIFVAAFVGEPSMAFIPVELKSEKDTIFAESGGGLKIELDAAWIKSQAAWQSNGKKLTMGLRPPQVLLPDQDNPDPARHNQGIIYAVEPMGAQQVWDIEVGKDIVRVQAVTDDRTRRISTTIGDPIWIEVDPDRVYLFDTDTEKTVAQAKLALKQEGLL